MHPAHCLLAHAAMPSAPPCSEGEQEIEEEGPAAVSPQDYTVDDEKVNSYMQAAAPA